MKTKCKRVGCLAIFGVLFAVSAALAQEEYSGAFYFGEAGAGDGVLGPGDLGQLRNELWAGAGVYTGCNPADGDVQDLDGDAVIGAADLSILRMWIAVSFSSGAAGKPSLLEPVSGTNEVPAGGGAVICVQLSDNPANGDYIKTPRAGWGVNFMIDPSCPCATATLFGRDPTPTLGLGKDQYIIAPVGATVFEYTSRIDDGGQACFIINAPGCLHGQVIPVNYYVPGDAEALYSVGTKGRFPTRLDGTPSQILVSVN